MGSPRPETEQTKGQGGTRVQEGKAAFRLLGAGSASATHTDWGVPCKLEPDVLYRPRASCSSPKAGVFGVGGHLFTHTSQGKGLCAASGTRAPG